ncbi:YbaN family protein [Pistricoccus aurantiacus]|uniref:YbaN family protein n=1 Tax=Pistricoccus aurantiacus TaxID=1883414 RepID=UPI003642AE29
MATPGKLSRLVYRCLAFLCIGLGAIGAVLPLLPTTPFLLVAAWAAPKGSPRLATWLWRHPHLGPPLIAWREQRAVPRRAKWLACCLLLLSWSWLAYKGSPLFVLIVTGVFFCCVATFLLTRPNPTTSTTNNNVARRATRNGS